MVSDLVASSTMGPALLGAGRNKVRQGLLFQKANFRVNFLKAL